MKIYVFDMDGTLTPARLPMTEEFKRDFIPFLQKNICYIATGSDYKKIDEQMSQDVIDEFTGIYASMGNVLYKKGELVYKKEIEYDKNLLNDLENFRKTTKYPNQLFGNYIEKRTGMINFSVIGRDCTYSEREKYTAWDKENGERKNIQEVLSAKYPDYDFEAGGNISIDIIPKGCGKGQIAHHLRKQYPDATIIFTGDRTYKGGNDYALAHELSLMENTKVVQVENPDETMKFLRSEEN